ncbi:MAG: molybdate ABC transporter permease subunit [Terrimicrobiaceae bacterium]|nr:molybdate ABC transporter permease subunit [Terrimicrobiaceae bacterium]
MGIPWEVIGLTGDLWQSLWLTIRLALATTTILILIGLPLAQFLNNCRWRGIVFLEALVTLPIVLPPTVIGFYLLVAFAPQNLPGWLWERLTGHPLVFTFSGLVVGSVIYSLPFAVQPFQSALKAVPLEVREAAMICGATPLQTFWHVTLPLARRGIGVGVTLSFAHTIGEFGVVLMLGGNIPGVTRVASIALFDEVQKLNYAAAHAFALVLLAISFTALLTIGLLQRKKDPAE